jgi:hypothetical protein
VESMSSDNDFAAWRQSWTSLMPHIPERRPLEDINKIREQTGIKQKLTYTGVHTQRTRRN